MATYTGCQDARNAITIKEVACPSCGDVLELFIRDGKIAAAVVCDNCGYSTEPDAPEVYEKLCG